MMAARKRHKRERRKAHSAAEKSESDAEKLRALVFTREWFHSIDLGHGIITPGIDDSPAKLTGLRLPTSFAGKSVLDIGAWDGFFSFEAERRGAARVVAADYWCWNNGPEFMTMADGQGFESAHAALSSKVEKAVCRVEEIGPDTVGVFDYVLFLGVLYHAPDPLRYLRHVFSVCRDMAIIETHTDGADYDRPMMVFYPGGTLNNDPSNNWGPNRQCVLAMLHEVGFERVEVVEHQHQPQRLVVHAYRSSSAAADP